MLIIVTAAVIASSFILSSAQDQPSAQCIAAYNATFGATATDMTCATAYYSLLFAMSVTDEQRMMVCDAGQQCNAMIENIISICGDTIDNPTRLSQDLLCTANPNGGNCLLPFISLIGSIENGTLDSLDTDCATSCTPECRQGLMQLDNTFGCCLAETVQSLANSGTPQSPQITLYTTTYPERCGLEMIRLCNGDPLPTDACDTAFSNLLFGGDQCSMNVQEVIINGNDSLSAILSLYQGNCPAKFEAYATACSDEADHSALIQVALSVVNIGQAMTSSGRPCTDLLSLFFNDTGMEDEVDCAGEYLLGRCPASCRQQFMDGVEEYGCCLNTVLGELVGRNDQVTDQVEYIILTRELYSFCGISSGGFCTGTTPPPYTNAANQCIRNRNSFFGDDTCLDYYLSLIQRSSTTEVNDAATAICASQTCKNRMRGYMDYLINCRVENILMDDDDDDDDDDNDDDDDDDDDDDVEDNGYLELAYLIGNTTCRVDNSNTSCYSTYFFDVQYVWISEAFDTDNETAVCVSARNGLACSPECTQLLTDFSSSVGCCLGEYGRALLGDEVLTTVMTSCGVTSIGDRCTEPEAIQDVEDGANTQRGLGIMAILLLGMVAIMLS